MLVKLPTKLLVVEAVTPSPVSHGASAVNVALTFGMVAFYLFETSEISCGEKPSLERS